MVPLPAILAGLAGGPSLDRELRDLKRKVAGVTLTEEAVINDYVVN